MLRRVLVPRHRTNRSPPASLSLRVGSRNRSVWDWVLAASLLPFVLGLQIRDELSRAICTLLLSRSVSFSFCRLPLQFSFVRPVLLLMDGYGYEEHSTAAMRVRTSNASVAAVYELGRFQWHPPLSSKRLISINLYFYFLGSFCWATGSSALRGHARQRVASIQEQYFIKHFKGSTPVPNPEVLRRSTTFLRLNGLIPPLREAQRNDAPLPPVPYYCASVRSIEAEVATEASFNVRRD